MTLRTLLAALIAGLLCPVADAQIDVKAIEKSIPPITIPTKLDAQGLKQWGEFNQNCPACKAKKFLECRHCKHLEEPEICAECDKTRKAPCHYCTGTGKLPDPLSQAPCPGCRSHSVFLCHMCANTGRIKIVGGGKKGVKCSVCKGNGGRACTVCAGTRLVPALFKGKVGSTDLKKLRKAKAVLETLTKDVLKFSAIGQSRIDRKKFSSLFKKARSTLLISKKFLSQMEAVSKGMDQPRFKGNAQTQVASMDLMRTYLVHYLLHQTKVLDLCIARAEHNAEAAKARK